VDLILIKKLNLSMRHALFLLSFSTIFQSFGQISYDFSDPLPIDEKSVTSVSSSNFGTYISENNETKYIFDSKGIWIETTIFSSISKETIRESSRYVVRNGFIFGVVTNDSLPCVLDNERYHFGLKNKEQVAGGNSLNSIKKLNSSSYILNYFENGGYIPSLFSFTGKNLTIQHFDYETGTNQFSTIIIQSSKKIDGMNYITLSPSKDEWKELDKVKLFGSKNIYLRN
jgi:hypothetical protein